MRVVKAAGVQLSPVLYSREGTVEKVVRKIHELGQQGVQFATFPETVVPYYPYFSLVQTPLQIIVGPEHLKLLDQAVDRAVPCHRRYRPGRQAGGSCSVHRRQRA
jgi:nitrilase